jgi:succinyl-CoA synthetase beta subunit
MARMNSDAKESMMICVSNMAGMDIEANCLQLESLVNIIP